MLAPLVAALLFPQPIEFGAYPIWEQTQKGAKWCRDGKSLESLYDNDRTVIGWWNDGAMAKPEEWTLWISPSFVSRWLGYLDRRELWTGEELGRRYEAMSNALDGRLTFLVQLVAYPKQSLLEITEEAPATPQEIERIRFVFTVEDKRIEPRVQLLAHYRWRDRSYAQNYRWWLDFPALAPLTPEWLQNRSEPPYAIGGWYASWYLVQVTTIPEMFASKTFALHVLSPRKERVAVFPAKKPDLIPKIKFTLSPNRLF